MNEYAPATYLLRTFKSGIEEYKIKQDGIA